MPLPGLLFIVIPLTMTDDHLQAKHVAWCFTYIFSYTYYLSTGSSLLITIYRQGF